MSIPVTSIQEKRIRIGEYIASVFTQLAEHIVRHHTVTPGPGTEYCSLEPGNALTNIPHIDIRCKVQQFNWACYHCQYYHQRITTAEAFLAEIDKEQHTNWCRFFSDIPDTARICTNFPERINPPRNHEPSRGQPTQRPSSSLFGSYTAPEQRRSGAPSPSSATPSSSEISHLSLSPHHATSSPACNDYTSIASAATNSHAAPAMDEPCIPPSPASAETNTGESQPFIPSFTDFCKFMETAPLSSLEDYAYGSPDFTCSSFP
jgi:hypothetical protein